MQKKTISLPVESIESHISRNFSGFCGGVAPCKRSNDAIGMIVFGRAIEVLMNVGHLKPLSTSVLTSLTSNPTSNKKSSSETDCELHSDS